MKTVVIGPYLLFLLIIISAASNAEESGSVIKVGMHSREAEKTLVDFGAQETGLDMAYLDDSEPTECKAYQMPGGKPVIVIDCQKDNSLIIGISVLRI